VLQSHSRRRIEPSAGRAGVIAASRYAHWPFRWNADEVRPSILIVDDNERFLEVASISLDRDGFDVVGTARTGAQAMRLAEDLRPHVVLVDIGLGNESGFDLARELVGVHGDGRVLLISTHAEEDFTDLIEASPAIGFLSKSELSADAIQALLRRAGSEPRAI
jgi:DNA-binding NarL/FixJ family response regulator